MKITTDDIEATFNDMCKMHWAHVLDMVKENAPEDAKIISEHHDVCLKLFSQGVHVGWNSGAKNVVSELRKNGFIEEY